MPFMCADTPSQGMPCVTITPYHASSTNTHHLRFWVTVNLGRRRLLLPPRPNIRRSPHKSWGTSGVRWHAAQRVNKVPPHAPGDLLIQLGAGAALEGANAAVVVRELAVL